MSALSPKADKQEKYRCVRFVPKAAVSDCSKAALYSMTSSARASSMGGTSMPSALAVTRLTAKSKMAGNMMGKLGGAFAFQNPASICSKLPIIVRNVHAIAHQTPTQNAFTKIENGRNGMTCRQRHKLLVAALQERITAYEQRIRALCHQHGKSRVDSLGAVDLQNNQSSPNTLRG